MSMHFFVVDWALFRLGYLRNLMKKSLSHCHIFYLQPVGYRKGHILFLPYVISATWFMLDYFFDRMLMIHLSNSTLERNAGNGQDNYFVSLPLTKWALHITGWHQCTPKKPTRHWLSEIVFGQNYVRFLCWRIVLVSLAQKMLPLSICRLTLPNEWSRPWW